MIVATIQGVSSANNGKHTTACNGKLVTGESQETCIESIFRAINDINVENEMFCEVAQGQYFCAIDHPQRDEINRIRTALILYDKDTSEEMIKQTLEVMGLEYERFKNLRSAYLKSQPQKSPTPKYTLWILGIIIAIFVLYQILS